MNILKNQSFFIDNERTHYGFPKKICGVWGGIGIYIFPRIIKQKKKLQSLITLHISYA